MGTFLWFKFKTEQVDQHEKHPPLNHLKCRVVWLVGAWVKHLG